MVVNIKSKSYDKSILYYLNTYGILLKAFKKLKNIELVDIKSRPSLLEHIKTTRPSIVAIDYNCKWTKLSKDITYLSLTLNVPILLICNEKIYKGKNSYLKQLFKVGVSDIVTPKTTCSELEETLSLMLEMHPKIPQLRMTKA